MPDPALNEVWVRNTPSGPQRAAVYSTQNGWVHVVGLNTGARGAHNLPDFLRTWRPLSPLPPLTDFCHMGNCRSAGRVPFEYRGILYTSCLTHTPRGQLLPNDNFSPAPHSSLPAFPCPTCAATLIYQVYFAPTAHAAHLLACPRCPAGTNHFLVHNDPPTATPHIVGNLPFRIDRIAPTAVVNANQLDLPQILLSQDSPWPRRPDLNSTPYLVFHLVPLSSPTRNIIPRDQTPPEVILPGVLPDTSWVSRSGKSSVHVVRVTHDLVFFTTEGGPPTAMPADDFAALHLPVSRHAVSPAVLPAPGQEWTRTDTGILYTVVEVSPARILLRVNASNALVLYSPQDWRPDLWALLYRASVYEML